MQHCEAGGKARVKFPRLVVAALAFGHGVLAQRTDRIIDSQGWEFAKDGPGRTERKKK